MKIKNGFLLRPLADTFVVVPVGQAAVDLRGMITLNGTGAFLWKMLETEQTAQTLVEALLDTYQVTPETAAQDVARFLELLCTNDLLEGAVS